MTAPTDNQIRAYVVDLIRDYAAGFDYLDLAEHMHDQDTIGDTHIADLDGPEIDDLQRRILDAMHAWGADGIHVDALRQTDETPHAARLAQIRDRNRRLAAVPWNRHGGTGTPSCIPCELVRAIDDVSWLLERLDVLRSATDTAAKFATEMERLRKNDPSGAQWLENILAAPAEQQPQNNNTTCAFPGCVHPDHQRKQQPEDGDRG